MPSAESIRVSAAASAMLRPGIRRRRTATRRIKVYVHRVCADVLVVVVAGTAVVVVVIVRVIVTIAAVIAAVIVTAVPGRIAVIDTAVINDGRAVPTTVPAAVAPTATPMAHHCAYRNTSTKPDNACSHHGASGVPGVT